MDGWLLTLLTLRLLCFIRDVRGGCEFPSFLQRPLKNGATRTWLTRTEYSQSPDRWKTQQEVSVRDGVITTITKYRSECFKSSGDSSPPSAHSCVQEKVVHKRFCLHQHSRDKFLVEHFEEGNTREHLFTCLHFIERNKNVVQVKSAILSPIEDLSLCSDTELRKGLPTNEWPWIVPEQEQWSYCPALGGFDFNAYMKDFKQKLCHKEWRPSRMESECISGEGVKFSFPNGHCNPFGHGLEKTLQCWAHWTDGDFMYIIAGEEGIHPHYTIRVPVERKLDFEGHLYFTAVCPVDGEGKPPESSIRHITLRMKNSPRSHCYDESEKCAQFRAEGKCKSHPPHQYANYCKLSCGNCERTKPSLNAECSFGIEGDKEERWSLFEDRKELDVKTSLGKIDLGAAGRFYCKARYWIPKKYRFKAISEHENGCRPRYSCIYYSRRLDGMAEYEIYRSELTDHPIGKLCKEEESETRKKFKEYFTKTLFLKSMLQREVCGLYGHIFVHTASASRDSREMEGELTDYHLEMCRPRGKFVLSLTSLDGKQHLRKEAACHAFIQVRDGVKIIITKDLETRHFASWVVKRSRQGHTIQAWQQIFIMQTANCGESFKGTSLSRRHPALILAQMENNVVNKPCGYVEPTTKSFLIDVIPSDNTDAKHVRSNDPESLGSRTSNASAPAHVTQKITWFCVVTVVMIYLWPTTSFP